MRLLKVEIGVLDDLLRLDRRQVAGIAQGIFRLMVDPHPPGVKKLKGFDDLYRLRVGDDRILYRVTPDTVEILAFGPRDDVYRRAEKWK